jgi:hypothetical protein
MAFLNRIPEEWHSRRTAVTIRHRLCAWLTERRYLDDNPWAGVDRSLVEGKELPSPPVSRAFTREAFAALLASLPDPTRPGATLNGFLLLLRSLHRPAGL